MITRAAVLERVGAPLEVTELELAPPAPGEVLVRLHASGVCHSDQNAIDGTAETPCPAVLGHEGGGVLIAVGPGVTRVSPRAPTSPSPGRRRAGIAPNAWTTCRTCAAPRGR